ncbi:acetate kinase [Anaerorhabdus sp.]|jgi:acetate kinase|uniref:acetate kinase n=2 Tax=Anaerorhabdus sp. TaxID=1872524 RepID=UPI002B1F4E79|nr:acetate kinase [Anaerorhabdus sp.]MEA4875008.1 acetate kinase [Anaerorhabdus sp.]
MSKIISVNAGSSSLKFQLFEMPSEEVLTSGIAERIGLEEGVFTIKVNGEKHTKKLPIKDHTVAVQLLLDSLIEFGVVKSLEEIVGAGHRVVQGGDYFDQSVIVTPENEKIVEDLSSLAPLHNPANLVGYRAFKTALPKAGHTFVFDTAFHQTMEPASYMYPVPYEWYTDYKVRRYGAHGTSHQYVAERTAELLGKDIKDINIITCHLGNGASITAVQNGKCVNTSMGFTPLAGVMMGTRCGDIDPAIVTYMQNQAHLTADEINDILNKKSGMLGISGISSDARDIEDAVAEGNERAKLTHAVYVNRVVNVLGGYFMQMGGVDAISFTAGLGENDTLIRKLVMQGIEKALGLSIDYDLNDKSRGKEIQISKNDSKVSVWVVPTNEELVIARDTCRLLGI